MGRRANRELEKVLLTREGYEIKVSPEDFNFLSQFSWRLNTQGYPITTRTGGGETTIQSMIMWGGGPAPKDRVADHINQNKLDNRRENLRDISRGLNRANSNKSSTKSGLKGAYQRPNGKFFSVIEINGKRKHLGDFNTAEEAHRAYLKAAAEREYH
jgi:hypothetical protein